MLVWVESIPSLLSMDEEEAAPNGERQAAGSDGTLADDPPQPRPYHMFEPRADQQQEIRRIHEADAAAAARAAELQRMRRIPQYEAGGGSRLGGYVTEDDVNVNLRRISRLNRRSVNPAIQRMVQQQMATQMQGGLVGGQLGPADAAALRAAVRNAVSSITSPETRRVLSTLVQNVVQSPEDATKRSLRESNAKLRATVFADGASRAALQLLGWQPSPDGVWQLPMLQAQAQARQLYRLRIAETALSSGPVRSSALPREESVLPREESMPAPVPQPLPAALAAWLAAHEFSRYSAQLQRRGVTDASDLPLVSDELLTSMGMPPDARLRFFLAAQQPSAVPSTSDGVRSDDGNASENEPPEDIVCPITGDVMQDPSSK